MLQRSTLELEQSRVFRSRDEQEVLDKFGASVLIVHLHGARRPAPRPASALAGPISRASLCFGAAQA